jgi:hypothetical protein
VCQQGRRLKTLDLHNKELLLVLGVLVQMSHRENRQSKQATTHRKLFVYRNVRTESLKAVTIVGKTHHLYRYGNP